MNDLTVTFCEGNSNEYRGKKYLHVREGPPSASVENGDVLQPGQGHSDSENVKSNDLDLILFSIRCVPVVFLNSFCNDVFVETKL